MKKDGHDIDRSPSWSKAWESLFTTSITPNAIGALATIISALAVLASAFSNVGVASFDPDYLLATIVVMIGTIFLIFGFTFVLSLRDRGPSGLARLKADITAAYLNALEQSNLNPANGKQP
uniref:Uncharacterized protein n=1 Tax=Candidatus Kentrum sp. LFY TaxID=2126342 RepID=A0A450UF82_9GAMM|nr:MAG: hypothetical protein BECKLFY1418B_GA0070995_102417 [Candidatus Kentron sp. LFY]